MTKFNTEWTVGPHGAFEDIDDGLISVSGEIVMPLGRFPRRMTVVRLADGGSLVWSAIALSEPEMARLEAFGTPRFLVVPNPGHRLDARLYRDRYPEAKVITPKGAVEAVSEAVPVDATTDVIGEPELEFLTVAGTDEAESALVIRRPSGTTLITNDIIGHITQPHGLGANIMARLFDYGVHEPSVPRTVRRFIKHPSELAAQMREWAEMPNLQRIIVSHVDPITEAPSDILRRLADDLDS
jgi:hypothetical protein